MKLGCTAANALAIGSALVWLVYGALGFTVLRPRTTIWFSTAFAVFIAATAAAPYPLDFGSWRILSYAMLYNRLAWAALCLASAGSLLQCRDESSPRDAPIALGACATWLWAIKPNYLLILFPLLLFSVCTTSSRGVWYRRAIASALIMLLGIWICVRFSPVGYVQTHFGMARIAPSELLKYTLARSLGENLWPVIGLLVLWSTVLTYIPMLPQRIHLSYTLGAVLVLTFVANLANCQFSEFPLWGAFGWLAAIHATNFPPATRIKQLVVIGGVAMGLTYTWQPLASIPYIFVWKQFRDPGSPPAIQVASRSWAGMPMRPIPGIPSRADTSLESAASYAAWLNDGLSLLTQVRPPHGAVLCLDWANPYPLATLTDPALGDEIAWHVGRTVGAAHHPAPQAILATVTVVMEPRRSIQPESLDFKKTLFGPTLRAAFIVRAETEHWRAWVRRDLTISVGHE